MRKGIISAFLVFFIASSIYAHPPTKLIAEYDKESGTLKGVISHLVKDPEAHYIERIKVTLGDVLVVDEVFKKQETYDQDVFELSITDVKSGDLITIKAYCNIEGSLEKIIEVK